MIETSLLLIVYNKAIVGLTTTFERDFVPMHLQTSRFAEIISSSKTYLNPSMQGCPLPPVIGCLLCSPCPDDATPTLAGREMKLNESPLPQDSERPFLRSQPHHTAPRCCFCSQTGLRDAASAVDPRCSAHANAWQAVTPHVVTGRRREESLHRHPTLGVRAHSQPRCCTHTGLSSQ